MIRLLLFLITLSASAQTNKIPEPQCREVSTSRSPFFVSDTNAQGDLHYENFTELENPLNSNRYLPKGSIVYTPPELYEWDDQPRRLPIKVLGVAAEELQETAKTSQREQVNRIFSQTIDKRRASAGDVGYIDKRSLSRAGEFTFYLNKEAPIYTSPKGNKINGKRLRVKTNDQGEFISKRCCFELPQRDDPICFQFNLYEILGDKGNILETAALKGLGCGFFGNLQAVPNTVDKSISQVYQLLNNEVHEELAQLDVGDFELVSLPTNYKGQSERKSMIKFPVNPETNFAPFNMRKYKPTPSLDDTFVDPMVGCALLRVAQKWEQICSDPGCEIQFGNLYHHDDWQPHTTHDSGYCFDIRLFRKNDDLDVGLDFDDSRGGSHRYSRERTQGFMELLMRAGASDMIMGDSAVINHLNSKTVRERALPIATEAYWTHRMMGNHSPQLDPGEVHDNHIHACFNPENDKVQEACSGSLLEL